MRTEPASPAADAVEDNATVFADDITVLARVLGRTLGQGICCPKHQIELVDNKVREAVLDAAFAEMDDTVGEPEGEA